MSNHVELPCTRSYFYVGGRYTDTGAVEHIFQEQMYVEELDPISGPMKEYPLVFIHGNAQTGTGSLYTPASTASDIHRTGSILRIIARAGHHSSCPKATHAISLTRPSAAAPQPIHTRASLSPTPPS